MASTAANEPDTALLGIQWMLRALVHAVMQWPMAFESSVTLARLQPAQSWLMEVSEERESSS